MFRRYPSLQQVAASRASSPRSTLISKALESLDETVYHLYSDNEGRAKTRVIETATTVLQLAQLQVLPPPAEAHVCNNSTSIVEVGSAGDCDDDERTTASPAGIKLSADLPPTAKRSNTSVSRSLDESFSTLRVGDDERSTESSTGSCIHGSILCTQPCASSQLASPMSMGSVINQSSSKTSQERIKSTVLYLRIKHPKTGIPLSIDTLRDTLPALGPMIADLLPDVDDSTYATRERILDCNNEMEEANFVEIIQPAFYHECFSNGLRGKSYEQERRLFRMLKLLVETGGPEVLQTLDDHDGSRLIDDQRKYFSCSCCGLIFTRNNIIKHSACLASDAKLPIQECLAEKFRFFAKLLEESSKGSVLSKSQRDAVGALKMKINSMEEKELMKARSKFPHFARFEKALRKSNVSDLPMEKALMFQQV